MPTYQMIQSYLSTMTGDALVIDIRGANTKPGTPLDSYTANGNDNQLWTLELDVPSGWYFIQSKLTDPMGKPLVIDIQKAGNNPGTPLDSYTKKSANYDNQLWKFVEALGFSPGWYFIQSKLNDPLGNPLVVDIQGASNKPGTPLDSYTEKSTNYENQLWQLV